MMKKNNLSIDDILSKKIIAILRGIDEEHILDTVKSLYEGGIISLEIAINNNDKNTINKSIEYIKLVNKYFGDKIYIGAGTVLDENIIYECKKAGAKFIISPNVNEKVIKKTKNLGLISIPGAQTATEIYDAYKYGADCVKVFPIDCLGENFIKDMKEPLPFIKMIAVGKVDMKNIKKYLSKCADGVAVGGALVDKNFIMKNEYKKIVEISKKFVKIVDEFTNEKMLKFYHKFI